MQQNTASNWMGWFLNPGCLMAPCSSGCIYGDENVHPGVEGLVLETGQQRMVVWSLQGFMMLRTSQNLDELSMYPAWNWTFLSYIDDLCRFSCVGVQVHRTSGRKQFLFWASWNGHIFLMDLWREGQSQFISPLGGSWVLLYDLGKNPVSTTILGTTEGNSRVLLLQDVVVSNSSVWYLWDPCDREDTFLYTISDTDLCGMLSNFVNNGLLHTNAFTTSLPLPCIIGVFAAFQMLLMRKLEVIVWPRLLSQ